VALLADIVSRVRVELGDLPKQFTYTATGDGTNKEFNLKLKPIDPYSLLVTINSVPVAAGTGYTLEQEHGIIHFDPAPELNDSIEITGTQFRYFTDDDLESFVNTAVSQHTYQRTDSYGSAITIGRLPAVEEYPLAILATIEALWALATDSAFDINIVAPDGVTIPRAQRFQQLTTMIQARWDQYKQLSSALNIGLWRIEMGTLRRVSRTTNKLVPVWMPQEVDDARKPERVYLENNLKGYAPAPTTAAIYDLVIYQGDSYSVVLDFPIDTSDLEFKAQIRTYPNAPALYAEFEVEILNNPSGQIRLKLTKSQTAYLPVRSFWDLQATKPSDPDFQKTYVRGQVFVTQQVTVD
jgi:hypothetical protein